MPRPLRPIAVRIIAARSRKQRGGWSARSFSVFLIRRQGEAGLLRDGGMTAAEVGRYVRDLRQEVEQEIALRMREHRH